MKFILYIITILLMVSCVEEDGQSGWTQYKWINNSDHIIELKSYYRGEVTFDFHLEVYGSFEDESYGDRSSGGSPIYSIRFAGNDSVLVIFNDTLLIQYETGRVAGNPMLITNYELLEDESKPYVFLFEFTNEDYERALERGRIIN